MDVSSTIFYAWTNPATTTEMKINLLWLSKTAFVTTLDSYKMAQNYPFPFQNQNVFQSKSSRGACGEKAWSLHEKLASSVSWHTDHLPLADIQKRLKILPSHILRMLGRGWKYLHDRRLFDFISFLRSRLIWSPLTTVPHNRLVSENSFCSYISSQQRNFIVTLVHVKFELDRNWKQKSVEE